MRRPGSTFEIVYGTMSLLNGVVIAKPSLTRILHSNRSPAAGPDVAAVCQPALRRRSSAW